GFPTDIAFPPAYSPTMLLVLAPLCLVPLPSAFAVWSLAGVLALAWAALRGGVRWMALLALVSPLAVDSMALGQTAILTTAALLFLMAEHAAGSKAIAPAAIVLWTLTAKPPVAVTAGAALLATGRWRVVALAAVMIVVSTVALRPWLGAGWTGD